ncbi:MAG: polyprenol monophosphomannose synthase [Bdellovibrionaceae bacterium]|jgi:dolichol-phosphate mannosyltransferase|nr:polyprenol monophosphomannose synthase [Pseudobdellovibrionaceae bacterium]
MKILVVVPTYNEKDNIPLLIQEVQKLNAELNILVVDDSSPDGTGDIVKSIGNSNPKVHLLSRAKKEGLGKAYLAGFSWGIENSYDVICEMDADFSHRPVDLIKLISAIEHKDYIVGSRYVPGGSTVNWGFLRKLISIGGSLYSRMILGYPLKDWTGGFNLWKKETLIGIDYKNVSSEGYCFQIELKYRALVNEFDGQEVPITFEERRVGQSKMSFKIVLEAFYKVWMLRYTLNIKKRIPS